MAEYIIQDTTLTAIADEIRTLSGTTDTMTTDTMKTNLNNANDEINNQGVNLSSIESQLTDAISLLDGKGSSTVAVLNYEKITITPDGSEAVYTPSDGYNAFNFVQVNGSSNLVPKYIKNDITIFGVTGKTQSNVGTNGTEWTRCETNYKFNSVYYANGIWVAVEDHQAGSETQCFVYYSSDGERWYESNIIRQIDIIHYANGIWVAACNNYGLYYSTDGKTWVQSNVASGWFGSIHNANGIWVVGALGNLGLYYSIDGMTWTQSISQGSFYVYNTNGIWVAVSTNNKGVYYSIDGITWTQSNITSGYFKNIYYANGIWVVGCNSDSSNNGLYYSDDGKTWISTNITSGVFNSVYNANGIWVACSGSDNGLYYSVTWE